MGFCELQLLTAALQQDRRLAGRAPAPTTVQPADDLALAGNVTAAPTRPKLTVFEALQLWRARHRHRRELALMFEGEMKDARLSADLVAHEIRKWPWQAWNPQWRELDEVLLRGQAARRRRDWQPSWRPRLAAIGALRIPRPAAPAFGLIRVTANLRRRTVIRRDRF